MYVALYYFQITGSGWRAERLEARSAVSRLCALGRPRVAMAWIRNPWSREHPGRAVTADLLPRGAPYRHVLLHRPACCLFKRRHIHTVADRFMFKIPGWSSLLEGLCVIPGTVQTCSSVLRSGNPLAISPGGVYEAQFGDNYYKLLWKSRIGFAKVAQEAKVPIVPMFTQNVREAFRTVGWLRGACLRVYAATRVPLAPVYGGFPVKLVTHLGAPIPHDPNLTPHQLQQKVADAIENLVEQHQRVPGSILLALIERVHEMPKRKTQGKGRIANGKCQNGTANGNGVSDSCHTDKAKVS
ncbi:hypothetical protein ACJJTC_008163 [Scirpophaga incertulas]